MRSILYNLVLAPVMAAAALAGTAAMAATTLQVPFNFKVADKTYPAGAYSVQRSHTGDFVTLKSKDNNSSFMWAVGPGNPLPTDARVVLNFDQLDQTHILRSVQYQASTTPRLDKNIKHNERTPITQGQ